MRQSTALGLTHVDVHNLAVLAVVVPQVHIVLHWILLIRSNQKCCRNTGQVQVCLLVG